MGKVQLAMTFLVYVLPCLWHSSNIQQAQQHESISPTRGAGEMCRHEGLHVAEGGRGLADAHATRNSLLGASRAWGGGCTHQAGPLD